MKFKKIAAAALFAAVTGLGVLGGAGAASADPFEGHYEGCSGQHDGSHCYDTNNGMIVHLNI